MPQCEKPVVDAFEGWWADLSPEFDVDPDYPLTDDHKDMARAGWEARQPEIDALTAERDRLRAALERVAGAQVSIPIWLRIAAREALAGEASNGLD